MKIFIAGCGRSGTTLTLELMNCFADTYVFPSEAPVARFFDMPDTQPNKVVKRTALCWKYLHLLPDDIKLIYCIRHPFDVLTSRHQNADVDAPFHIDQRRWSAEYTGLRKLREQQPSRAVLYSRYEDLVFAPDGAQQRIAAFAGLLPTRLFSSTSISRASVQKWKYRPDLHDYLMRLPPAFVHEIGEFCRDFNYDMPARSNQTT